MFGNNESTMYALKLFVTSALVCCVFSETEKEKISLRFCVDTCNKEGFVHCANGRFPEWIETYDKCLSSDEKGFSSITEFNKFYCEKTSREERLRILNCFFDDMWALYTGEYVMNASKECLRKNGC